MDAEHTAALRYSVALSLTLWGGELRWQSAVTGWISEAVHAAVLLWVPGRAETLLHLVGSCGVHVLLSLQRVSVPESCHDGEAHTRAPKVLQCCVHWFGSYFWWQVKVLDATSKYARALFIQPGCRNGNGQLRETRMSEITTTVCEASMCLRLGFISSELQGNSF